MKGNIMKDKVLISQVYILDEYYDEYPNFFGIVIDEEFIKKIEGYQNAIKSLRATGLNPYKMSEWDSVNYYLDPSESCSLNKEEQEQLIFVGDDTKREWELQCDEEEYMTLNEMDAEVNFRTECDTLNITETGFYFRGIVKHTNIVYESEVMSLERLKELIK